MFLQLLSCSDKKLNNQREIVERLKHEGSTGHAIVCDNLKKVYPGRDGNPPKLAVKGLYLDVPSGECFGMLGPNGAGKTSFINMVSFSKPLLLHQTTFQSVKFCNIVLLH